MAFAHARKVRLIVNVGVQLARGLPEGPQRAPAAAVVPHARRDDAALAGDARHLRQTHHRVLHEVDHELREGHVKRTVLEGQLLRGGLADGDTGIPRRHGLNERFRRVDGRDSSPHRRAARALP